MIVRSWHPRPFGFWIGGFLLLHFVFKLSIGVEQSILSIGVFVFLGLFLLLYYLFPISCPASRSDAGVADYNSTSDDVGVGAGGEGEKADHGQSEGRTDSVSYAKLDYRLGALMRMFVVGLFFSKLLYSCSPLICIQLNYLLKLVSSE